jgi:hypothetical protein
MEFCGFTKRQVYYTPHIFSYQIYSRGQKKVGQVLLTNLDKIELSKPGLL